jgi:large subunit ribosomal protein L6e
MDKTKSPAPAKTAAKAEAGAKSTKRRNPRNWELGNTGLMRFSRAAMYRKRAIYKKKRNPIAKKAETKKPTFVEKQIGGDKNSGKRRVPAHRLPRYYPTEDAPKNLRSNKKPFSAHKHTLRKSIQAGTVLIVVAGKQKGKRVVFLKQLASGLLLITGPYTFNGCPLRRMNQRYVIATSTRLNIEKVNVPEHIKDDYFKRKREKTAKKSADAALFETKKQKFVPSEQRKADQKTVDSQLCGIIKSHPESSLLKKYMRSLFSLKKGQFPHALKF